MMDPTLLILERKERIAILTLNRPNVMNAINNVLRQEIVDAFHEFERDEAVDVVIITGSGRAFCAGRDLKDLARQVDQGGKAKSAFSAPRFFSKPIIAAVNGFCITGGLEMALNCDIIIASEQAKFSDTHARVGIMPNAGLSQILPRLVGIKKAKEMSFTGNFLSAQEALQCGLVNKVVTHDELLPAAEKLAIDILACDQAVVRKMKRLIDQSDGQPIETALMMERYESLRHARTLTGETIERRKQGVIGRGKANS